MITRKLLFVLVILLISISSQAQKRYKEDVFDHIDSLKNIQYGTAVNIKEDNEALLLDVFTPPVQDTVKHRPLLIYIHGGGFQNNTKNGIFSSMLEGNIKISLVNCTFSRDI